MNTLNFKGLPGVKIFNVTGTLTDSMPTLHSATTVTAVNNTTSQSSSAGTTYSSGTWTLPSGYAYIESVYYNFVYDPDDSSYYRTTMTDTITCAPTLEEFINGTTETLVNDRNSNYYNLQISLTSNRRAVYWNVEIYTHYDSGGGYSSWPYPTTAQSFKLTITYR